MKSGCQLALKGRFAEASSSTTNSSNQWKMLWPLELLEKNENFHVEGSKKHPAIYEKSLETKDHAGAYLPKMQEECRNRVACSNGL